MEKRVIPYGRQDITEDDVKAVVSTLKSDYLTQGPRIPEFERNFAQYIGVKYAVAVSNGTSALHLSALALGVKPRQKVITTPITFAASANCVKYAGGEVVFADIDPETFLLDIDAVERLVTTAPKGTYAGVIPVDFAGRAIDLERLKRLADEYGLWILEDACHAPGGYFKDSHNKEQHCGNSQFSDTAIFSFHPVKHIAAGEGGMVTTNDEKVYKQLLQLRTHGITKEGNLFSNAVSLAGGQTDYPKWYMEMQELGYNYRLSDMQAALGNSQLQKAKARLKKRREIAQRYATAFQDKDFLIRQSGVIDGHAYHLYVIEVEDRLGLYNFLRTKGIYAQIHYIPVHLMPYYRQFGWKEGDFPNAERYYKHCISLPMYPTLTREEQDFVIQTVQKYYE